MIIMVLIFLGTIFTLIKYQQKSALVFGLAFVLTYFSNNITDQQVVASFSNQGLLILILLMTCSLAIEKTSLIRWLTGRIESRTYFLSWLKLFLSTAIGSAFLNNTAVVSTMISPVRNNPTIAASKLLLPLSYAAILGGTLTLIGTSTNLIVNSMLTESGHAGFEFFSFTLVGLFAFFITGVVIYFVSLKLPVIDEDKQDFQCYLLNAKVLEHSNLIGKSVSDAGLRHLESLFLVEISRENKVISPISPNELLKANDRLVFSGDVRQVSQIKQFDGIEIVVDSNSVSVENMTEVVVRPDSDLINSTLKKADFRSKFNAAVIAFKRDGEALSGKLGEIKVHAGDYLVLVTGHDFSKRQNVKKNFITLSGVEPNHKLTGKKQTFAIGGFLTAILLSAVGVVSLFKALVILFGLFMFTGCLTFQDIKQRLPYNIWLIVGSAIALSHGLSNTGVLAFITSMFEIELTLANGFYFLIGLYLVTLVLTELITNNAAAALMFPLAYGLPLFYQIEPMPFILAVAFAASSSFISPYGYQTNLMVFNAGHYKLIDFVKAGVPVSLTFSTSVLYAIYLFYPIVKV